MDDDTAGFIILIILIAVIGSFVYVGMQGRVEAEPQSSRAVDGAFPIPSRGSEKTPADLMREGLPCVLLAGGDLT